MTHCCWPQFMITHERLNMQHITPNSKIWDPLQGRHMSIILFQITGNPIVCLRVFDIKENTKALCYWSFVKVIHRLPVDSPHKGPVTWKRFLGNQILKHSDIPDGYIWKNQGTHPHDWRWPPPKKLTPNPKILCLFVVFNIYISHKTLLMIAHCYFQIFFVGIWSWWWNSTGFFW